MGDLFRIAFKAACALVESDGRRGTGYLIRPDIVLTCCHVVEGAAPEQISLRFPHGTHQASILVADAETDCALLQLAQPVAGVKPLRLASEVAKKGSEWECYGFPAATFESGLLIDGRVHDPNGQDLQGRPAIVLQSLQISAGVAMRGFSGSPVLVGEQVIGQLVQVIPDPQRGAQFGVVYATPAASIIRLGQQVPSGPNQRWSAQPPQLPYDANWYIERTEEESAALDALEFPGSAVAVVAPELFGKTWLVQRLLTLLAQRGRVVNLNLRAFADAATMASYSLFLQELARQVLLDAISVSSERAAEMIEDAWRYSRNPIDNLNRLMESAVLPAFNDGRWLILAIDGVDALIRHPYLSDFFTLLRGWMEEGFQPPWSAMRLLLTLSTAPRLLISNVDQSPFNVATRIELSDLGPDQVMRLAALHRLSWSTEQCRELMDCVGGHPYLLRLAFYRLSRKSTPVAELTAPTSPVFVSYLRHLAGRLRSSPALQKTFLAILRSERGNLDFDALDRLGHAGLLLQEPYSGDWRIRYPLYRYLGAAFGLALPRS